MDFIVMFIGIGLGIITGLFPGIHVNLITSLVILNYTKLSIIFSDSQLVVLILSMAITHTFLDFIPNIFLMLPSSDNCLSLMPAQRLLMKGKSFEAVYISGLGSLTGTITGLFLIPIFYNYINIIEYFGRKIIKYILILSILIIIIQSLKKKRFFWTLFIIFFSSILGFLSLNSYHLNYNLSILFSGLFGFPALFFATLNKISIPKQKINFKFEINKEYLKMSFFSTIISFLASIFPGIGNSQAITFLSIVYKKINSKIFIFGTSLINTLNFIFSLIVFININKIRNGVIVFFSSFNFKFINFYFLKDYVKIFICVSTISFVLLIIIGITFILIINKIRIGSSFYISLLFLLILLVFFLSGWVGISYFIFSISLGIICEITGVKKLSLMSVIVVPIIFLI